MSITAPIAAPDHHGFEPFKLTDPFASWKALREQAPVFYDDRIGYWVVSRYDDVKSVFDNWETFSSANAQQPVRPLGEAAKKVLAEGDFTAYSGLSARIPPDHTRIRAIATKAFTPRRYKVLEPFIRENVNVLIDRMIAKGEPGDILTDIAWDLPTITIFTLIGVPVDMIETVKAWASSRTAITWSDLTDDEQVPHAENLVAYWRFCRQLVADAKTTPGDNLVSDLVRFQAEGDEITDHEIASFLYSLLFAGHETTTTLISNTVRELLANDEFAHVAEDPELIPGAIDEVLRVSGSNVAWRRHAERDGGREPRPRRLPRPRHFRHHPQQCPRPSVVRVRHPLLHRQHARKAANEDRRRRDRAAASEPASCSGRTDHLRRQLVLPRPRLRPRPLELTVMSAYTSQTYTFAFDSVETPTIERLGGKCNSLAIMTSAGMPVPPGFAVTTDAFDKVMDETGLRTRIREILAGLDVHDVADVADVERRADHVRELILTQEIPDDVRDEVVGAYRALMARCGGEVAVAVRSSATAEDLPDASFAGQQDTYLWIVGENNALHKIRECWASLYTARAITYRLSNAIPDEGLSMAVAVQKMVNSRSSGVAMTLDPQTGDRTKIVVESSWGLGEMVVSGEVTPDNFLLDKVMMTVVTRAISFKGEELVPNGRGGIVRRAVAAERVEAPSLSDDELMAVARLAKAAEKHYGRPQDIEWAIDADLPDGDNVLLLQARPETIWSPKSNTNTITITSKGSGISAIATSMLSSLGIR